MIDPAAADVMFRWIGAARQGDLDTVVELSSEAVIETFAETGDLDDPMVRTAVTLGLERRFGPIDVDRCGVGSDERLLAPDLECLLLVTDPELVGVTLDEDVLLGQDQGILFTMKHTENGWLVAGWGGSYTD